MRKGGFWKTDWFLGVVVTAVMLAASGIDLIQSLERKAYDLGVQASSRTPSDKIAVIAIDDQSIANLGRWPWSRELHAKMTDLLAGAQAKVIGNTIFFSEPQVDAGYGYITKLLDIVGQVTAPTPEVAQMSELLQQAEQQLNTDRRLAESYAKANNVLLPILFQLGESRGRPDKALPDFVARNQLNQIGGEGVALPAAGVQVPVEILGGKALALGHLNATPDVDGGVRTEPLVLKYFDQYYPSFSLMVAAKSLNLGPADIKVHLGQEVRLGNLRIPTDGMTQMNTFFYKGSEAHPAFPVDSFYDVLMGKIPASKYAGKIVLIGATAAGVGSNQVTPVSPAMAPVLTLAHSVSSILQEHFFVTPVWGLWAGLGISLLVGIYLAVVLPRLSAGVGAVATTLLLSLLVGAHFGLMVGAGMWIQLMGAASLLLVGHLTLTTKRFLHTEQGKQKSDMESAESNRMLGLAF
ncbi:MAG TPA: CHASE2 domain-containing protein, partial [Rhodocyclaceae bacterium]|nr:CHASE2 domain-containing protein [Rhodocyclaceae bacterium]